MSSVVAVMMIAMVSIVVWMRDSEWYWKFLLIAIKSVIVWVCVFRRGAHMQISKKELEKANSCHSNFWPKNLRARAVSTDLFFSVSRPGIMVKGAKILEDEDVDDQLVASTETGLKRDRLLIVAVCARDNFAVQLYLTTFKAHRIDMKSSDGVIPSASTPHAKSKWTLAQGKRLAKFRECTHAAARAESSKDGNTLWIHSKYAKLGDFDVKMLSEDVTTKLEPISCSLANLRYKGTVKGSGSTMSKEKLLKLVEFLKGLPPTFEIKGPMRCWPYFHKIMAYHSERRGRRGQQLVLPINYSIKGNGVYDHAQVKNEIVVIHGFANVQVAVKSHDLPPFNSFAALFIEESRSESHARLKSKTSLAHPGLASSSVFSSQVTNQSMILPPPPAEAFDRLEDDMKSACAPEVLAIENEDDTKDAPQAATRKRTFPLFIKDTVAKSVASSSKQALKAKDVLEESPSTANADEEKPIVVSPKKKRRGKEFNDLHVVPPPPDV